jgi:hypothetical protein
MFSPAPGFVAAIACPEYHAGDPLSCKQIKLNPTGALMFWQWQHDAL